MGTSSLRTDSALTENFANIISDDHQDGGTGLPSSSNLSLHNLSTAGPLTRGNNTPPPPYSGPPQQPLFVPYITQGLPGYSQANDEASTPSHHRDTPAPHHNSSVPSSLATTVHPQNMSITVRAAVVPATHKGYLKLTFALLVCCILQLNIPAALCSLSALGFSIKARDLWTSGMYECSKQYSNVTLYCNILAVLEYIISTFIMFIFVFVFVVPQ